MDCVEDIVSIIMLNPIGLIWGSHDAHGDVVMEVFTMRGDG